jgi:hypothetical protein
VQRALQRVHRACLLSGLLGLGHGRSGRKA